MKVALDFTQHELPLKYISVIIEKYNHILLRNYTIIITCENL